jgi:hypothetical protein
MTTVLLDKEISMIVTSDPNQGAKNIDSSGSSFEITLEEPLTIPSNAQGITISVDSSTIWWNIANITALNNTFYIYGDSDDAIPVPQLYTVVIPIGLYDLTALNTAVQSGLEALGARTELTAGDSLPLVSFTSDSATQKVILRTNYINVYVDFQPTGTPRDLLGFDNLKYGPYAGSTLNTSAPNIAALNTVNYFLISSDLVQKGLAFNNRFNQIISQVLIDVAPGSQITSAPFNPPRINAQELSGASRSSLRFRLTDENLLPVDTRGEYWTARLSIRYKVPRIF